MNTNLGKRHKQAVQVLNTVDYDSDGNPVGLKEDSTNPLSANFGTEREPLRGGCYQGDGNNYIASTSVPFYDSSDEIRLKINIYIPSATFGEAYFICGKYSGAAGANSDFRIYYTTTGGNVLQFEVQDTIDGTVPISIDLTSLADQWLDIEYIIKAGLRPRVKINGIGYEAVSGINNGINYDGTRQFYIGNVTLSNKAKIFGLDLLRNGTSILHWNCSEHSGDTYYDSSGNGNHGQIINAITTTPEENSNSIHQYQDVYSFENEEGYSYGLKEFGYGYRLNGKTYVQVRNDSINTSILHNVEVDGLDFSFDIFCGKYIKGQSQKFLIYFATPIGQTLQIRISPDGYVQIISIIKDPDIVINSYYSKSKIDDSKPHNVRIFYNPGSGLSIFIDGVKDAAFSISQLCNNENIKFLSIGLLAGTVGDHALLKNINLQNVFEYKCNESTGTVAVDSSGNGNDGVIYYLSDYFHFNAETIIPKNCSTKLPPLTDIFGSYLNNQGKVPGKATFVQSNCFQGNGVGYGVVNQNDDFYINNFRLSFSIYDERPADANYDEGIFSIGGRGGLNIELQDIATLFVIINTPTGLKSKGFDEVGSEPLRQITISKYGTSVIFENTLSGYKSVVYFDDPIVSYPVNSFLELFYKSYAVRPANYSIWDLKFEELDSLGNYIQTLVYYPLCEPITDPSNHTYYDVSGNGNHATLVNGTDANEGKQDEFHYLQKGFSNNWKYSPNMNNNNFYNLPGQSGTYFVEMFIYSIDNSSSFVIAGTTTTSTKYIGLAQQGGTSEVSTNDWGSPSIYIDDVLFTGNSGDLYDALSDNQSHKIRIENIDLGALALGIFVHSSNPCDIWDVWHTYLSTDVTNGYWAKGEPDTFIVPQSAINTTKDALGNPITIPQNGKSFLNTGTKLQPYDYPALKQADKDNDFWYDADGNSRQTEFGKFKNENSINSKYYFGKNQYSTDDDIVGLTNITTYSKPLNSKQDNTEKQVRNVFETTSKWLLKSGQWDDNGIWDDKAYFDIKD